MEEYFEYLDDLRESGICNMLAAAHYLEDEFKLPHALASEILNAWIKSKETVE